MSDIDWGQVVPTAITNGLLISILIELWSINRKIGGDK